MGLYQGSTKVVYSPLPLIIGQPTTTAKRETVRDPISPTYCEGQGVEAFFVIAVANSAESTRFWRDPGPVEALDLAAGPGGRNHAPLPPFEFVEEETRGRWPKVVVLDASRRKWVVKFGEEAKAETFASRISWALGYPVRASYYVSNGRIQRVTTLKRAAKFIKPNGEFDDARFQMFDRDGFRQSPAENLISQRGDLINGS